MSVTGVNGSSGASANSFGPPPPGAQSPGGGQMTDGDRIVLTAVQNFANKPNDPTTAQGLFTAVLSQESPKGQHAIMSALNGSVNTPAKLRAYNQLLKQEATTPPLGPVTLYVDDILAKTAAQSGPGAPGPSAPPQAYIAPGGAAPAA